MSEHSHGGKTEPKFSATLFLITVAISLAGLFGLLAFVAPTVWQAQLAASWPSILATFLVFHLVAAFVEFFFHRYVLHAPLLPLLGRFYKQHTLHHALTRVGYQKAKHGPGQVPVLIETRAINLYPIEKEPQFEASYFPWYTLAAFAGLATIFLVPLQWLMPTVPLFLSGYLAIAWSLLLYELIHAIEHWPQATWDRLVEHPRFGRFWRKAYAFHLRHHADIRSNEAISGFFALPVPDLVLGTYLDPETLYTHGQPVDPKEFISPRPRFGVIRWLDRQAEESVKRRRKRRAGFEATVAAVHEPEERMAVPTKFATAADSQSQR